MTSSSDSDDDYYSDLAETIQIGSHLRKAILPKTNPLDYLTEKETLARFRFCKQSIHTLLSLLTSNQYLPDQATLKDTDIPKILQLLVALRFYATGSFQISNGDMHYVCQSSVSKIIKRVSYAIASLTPAFIKYPSFEEARNIRNEFLAVGNFPGVVGCIDCTHIKIKSPGGADAELFRNRKGYFSINAQAVCDSKLKFTNCVVRWPGSVHDSRIFDSSLLRAQLGENEVPGILLGDAGYRSLPYLLTPLDNPVTLQEKRYNKAQIKTRNYIERAFGVLKKRFHCLGLELRTKLPTSLSIITSCFVLHNYAIDCGMELPEEELLDDQPPTESSRNEQSASGLATRRGIISSHFSD